MGEQTATHWTEQLQTGVPATHERAMRGREAARGSECTRDPAASPEASPASCPGTGVSELTSRQAE